jgi:hypothetical protein
METVELAYRGLDKDGFWGMGLWERTREAFISAVDWPLALTYYLFGPFAVIILLGLLVWSIAKFVVTVIVRACVIYRPSGVGLWLLGAFWSLPFQLLITPARWASEATAGVTERVAMEMECQAHHEDSQRPVSVYPAFLLADMELGNSLYPTYIPCIATEVAIAKEYSPGNL